MSFHDERLPEPDTDELGPYPADPTPEAVRVYATRRADVAAARALRTGDPLDAKLANLWISRIEPAVQDAIDLQKAKARLAEQDVELSEDRA